MITGGAGNDIIHGVGTDTTGTTATTVGHDVAYGGAGNDIIGITGTNFTRIDGGLGADTLKIETTGLTLDLTAMGTRIQNIETFDLGTGTTNTLKLRLSDVINMSEPLAAGEHLAINGGGKVDLFEAIGTTGWSNTGTATQNGVSYNVYHFAGMNTNEELYIQTGITVS